MRKAESSDPAHCLAACTLRASKCALELHRKFHNYQPVAGITLKLHSAVSAGPLCEVHVGGVGGRWEYLLKGPPLAQLESAAGQAR